MIRPLSSGSPCGGIGRRGRLKICCSQGRASSSLAGGTKSFSDFSLLGLSSPILPALYGYGRRCMSKSHIIFLTPKMMMVVLVIDSDESEDHFREMRVVMSKVEGAHMISLG